MKWLGGLLALVLSGSAQAQDDAREIAFVANAEDGTVALFDIAARSVVGRVDINPARRRIDRLGAPNYAQDTDVSRDGRTLYVSRGYLGDVAAFDIASGQLLWTAPLKTVRADHMTLSADGRALFVSALTDNRVYRIETTHGQITGHVATGIYPHDNKLSRAGLLYNSSIGPIGGLTSPGATPADPATEPYQITVADAGTLQVKRRIKLAQPFRPWQFTPDQKGAYAQLSNAHVVIAYDLAAQRVTRRLELPVKPGVTEKDWDFEAPHHGLALTRDGRTLCLAARASDYVALVRTPALTLLATIPVGDAPGWAEVDEAGRTCLIADTRSDEISVISIPDQREVARVKIGDGPKHITVARVPAAVLSRLKPAP